MRKTTLPLLPLFFLLLLPADAAAADSGDTAWILASSALVLMMTLPGLALFYAGLVRHKNVISVFLHCCALAGMLSLLWAVCGYSLAFSGTGAVVGDLSRFFFAGIGEGEDVGTIPESVFALFQMTFAVITPALIVGAYVERIKFSALMLFSGLWLLVVYAPVAHWIWGGGFLAEQGVLDFAGGLVVHATAGVTALLIAWRLGARTGFPGVTLPNSPLLTGVGGCLLWVGWFGFNGGSALAADNSAGMAILATHLAAAAGMVVWMLLDEIRFQKTGVITAATGLIAGLATVTPAAGFIGPGGGIALGVAGGVVCYFAAPLLRQKWAFDDSLDVFAVHGVGGILGTLLLPFFALEALGGGGLESGVFAQFGVQLLGVVVVVGWSVGASLALLALTNVITPLRVNLQAEEEGLDHTFHAERGFNW